MNDTEAEAQTIFYVTRPAHVTFYKYAVKADTLTEAQAKFHGDGDAHEDVEYVGYIDGDWDTSIPDDWTDDGWVEGHG